MITKAKPAELSTRDLIDRIAKALPAEIGADYYREMMYCRSLQENDEILRILRAMQFLTLLMEQVPARVIAERQKLEGLFSEAEQSLKSALCSSESFQKQLDQRLIQLPKTIADGIKPETIAANINESLRQQFVVSTIPQTAKSLAAAAEQLKTINSEFSSTASALGKSYKGAAEEAHQAIEKMNAAVAGAAQTAKLAAKDLSAKFRDAYWSVLFGLALVALLAGFMLGAFLVREYDPPQVKVIERVIVPEPVPPARPNKR
jgi:methyl-accepting chemotaxis protein